MGTRSLLGYESSNGRIYAQYMQFDGDPATKGREYYEAVLDAMKQAPHLFIDDGGGPTDAFFKRIKNFLNNYQYQSGHSIGSHFSLKSENWVKAGQEWNYLFNRRGDFIITSMDSTSRKVTVVIPWEFTRFLAGSMTRLDILGPGWEKYWCALCFSSMDERKENRGVLKIPSDELAVHISDVFEYESSRAVLGKRISGVSVAVNDPVLSLEYGSVCAFPDQGLSGYRGYSILSFEGEVIGSSLFADRENKRDVGYISTKYSVGD